MRTPSSVRVVRRFYDQYVTERDRTLLNIVFHKTPTQACLDEALKVCDIEVIGSSKSLMLSYFMREHPELDFPCYVRPRLQGLIDFYRFANIRTLSHFSKIGKALNDHNIPMILFKGAAMKTLRPGFSRPMGDVDIIIPAEHMSQAVLCCKQLGYHDAMTGSSNAVDIHTANNEGAVDIHTSIMKDIKNTYSFHKGLWLRSRELETFGVRVFMPCNEDLLFIVLLNLTKNLREKSSINGLFYALLDAKFLLQDTPDFDWNIVKQNMSDTGTELPVRLAADFMNSLVPGIIPDVESHLALSPEIEDYCNQILFDEDYFNKRREFCQAIRVVDLKNYPWHYCKIIIKFLLLKRLRKYPSFVRWYLSTHERSYAN